VDKLLWLFGITNGNFASALPLLAMTHVFVIASIAWQSRESKTQKSKGKMTEQK
jgi:hypothetical protein